MTLRTGNRAGFTLVEVMVATAVLSLGIVMIYQSMFLSLDVFEYYRDYMLVASGMEERLWEAQTALSCLGNNASVASSGDIKAQNRAFHWNISYAESGRLATMELYKIILTVNWKRGRKDINLSREVYALHKTRQPG